MYIVLALVAALGLWFLLKGRAAIAAELPEVEPSEVAPFPAGGVPQLSSLEMARLERELAEAKAALARAEEGIIEDRATLEAKRDAAQAEASKLVDEGYIDGGSLAAQAAATYSSAVFEQQWQQTTPGSVVTIGTSVYELQPSEEWEKTTGVVFINGKYVYLIEGVEVSQAELAEYKRVQTGAKEVKIISPGGFEFIYGDPAITLPEPVITPEPVLTPTQASAVEEADKEEVPTTPTILEAYERYRETIPDLPTPSTEEEWTGFTPTAETIRWLESGERP